MSEANLRGKLTPALNPAPGSQHLRFVGDTIRFELSLGQGDRSLKAYLRTTLGQAREVLQSIINPVESRCRNVVAGDGLSSSSPKLPITGILMLLVRSMGAGPSPNG
ncbi:MAG TPA: hypothetical protein EYO78_00195, partial [Gammaproteobacteria bacterium]|nr:hypothetical protein [Gammaproteobacteria bacterium]